MLWWLTETTVVAGILALVAAFVTRLNPARLGPPARHALWLVVLTKLITPPLVTAPWALEVPLPRAQAQAERVEPDHATRRDGPTRLERQFASRLVLRGPVRVADSVEEAVIEEDDVATTSQAATHADRLAARWRELAALVVGALSWLTPEKLAAARQGSLLLWALATLGAALVQGGRIARFARKLHDATPAPTSLIVQTDKMADHFGVRAPEVLVVPGIAVPMLWCLGRPKLLLPEHLVLSLDVSRWRGVLAHELAHIRRGDPWVGRLALLAGLVWWWNPVYWLARRRLDAEAELACDAWVVWALPDDRVTYARTMLDLCESLCRATAPPLAPALGGSGASQLFERRLVMILNDRVPCRLTWPGLIAPGLLVLAGIPTWTAAAAVVADEPARPGRGTPSIEALDPPHVIILRGDAMDRKALDSKVMLIRQDDDAKVNAELKAKAAAARAQAEKHLAKVREESKAQFEKARAQFDQAAEQLKKATAEMKEVADANNAEARAHAERNLDKARAHLDEASNRLKNAEAHAAALAKAQARVEVRTEVRTDSKTETKTNDGKPTVKRRLEIRRIDPDGKEHVEVRELPEGLKDGQFKFEMKTPDGKPVVNHGQFRIEVKTDDKAAAEKAEKAKAKVKGEQNIEVEIKDLTKLFDNDSEFIKGLETLGPELQKRLGEAFGPGTEFDSKMKELGEKIGKELKENLGPGSDFDKAMKGLAKTLEQQFGPGSDFEKKVKEFAKEVEGKVGEKAEKRDEVKVEVKPRTADPSRRDQVREKVRERLNERRRDGDRDAHRKALEARIKALRQELEALEKANAKDDDDK